MEQINAGMLEMLKYVAASQMNPAKAVGSSENGESEFGKLLNEKNTEARKESTSGKSETDTKEVTDKDAVKTEKPKENKEETETCDVAREVACAQMVWMVPQSMVEEQAPVEMQPVEIAEVAEVGVMIDNAGQAAVEAVAVPEELPMTENGGTEMQETVVVEETGLTPDETVEAPEMLAQTETEPEAQTVVQHENAPVEQKETVETEDAAGEIVVAEAPVFHDVEAAPIKVAEAPAKAEAPELETQVSDNLVKILESGESRVEIQLNPEALGKMTIELTRSADGTLNVILNAENAETRNMLTRHITTLQETLVDRGQQNVQIEVSRGEETQQQNLQQQNLQDERNGGQNGQQRRRQESSGEDFLQQLRLGLIDLQEEI